MLVIVRCAGGKLAVPVIGQAHGAKLCSHGTDILGCPMAGMDTAFHGRILCGQAEGIPPHGMQNIIPASPVIACHHIAKRVVANMSHMDPARRVGEHLEDVIFRLVRTGFRDKAFVGFPAFLPFGLDGGRVVMIHECHPGGMP